MGAAVADDLLPGLPSDNTSGFWESRDIYNLHNQLFETLGVDWFNISNEVIDPTDSEAIASFQSGILSVIKNEFTKSPLIVLKDPRICILAKYWINTIREYGAQPVAVIPVRNPLEVAASLNQRNNIDIQYALFLWLRHFIDAERFSRDLPRSFCSFSELLNDWKSTIEKITADTHILWPNDIPDVTSEVNRFLSSDAKHQNTSEQQFFDNENIPKILKSSYNLAMQLVTSGDSPDIRRQLDAIYTTVLTIDDLVARRLVSLSQVHTELETQMLTKDKKTDKLKSIIITKEVLLKEKTADIQTLTAKVEKQKVTIDSLNNQKDEYLILLSKLESNLAWHSKNITILQQEADAIRNSWSWKLSFPLRRMGSWTKQLLNFPPNIRKRIRLGNKTHNSIVNIRHSRIFDNEFYAQQLQNTSHSHDDLIAHYCLEGYKSGLDPNPYFSTKYYLQNNPDIVDANENPFSHYLTNGWFEGRDPGPKFSTSKYLAANSDVADAKINPLVHYCTSGQFENRPLQPALKQNKIQTKVRFGNHSKHDDNPALKFNPEIAEKTKLVAFYLPQFHPIPENDEWWGKGFTEWTNVSSATPSFSNHIQPLLPGELGFYDLRMSEIREQQALLAKEFGIHGFCYYYYWFNGRRLLEKPLDDLLQSGKPDFPFCICWANEDWTRRWDGLDTDVLMAQRHSVASDQDFIQDVIPILKDPRYIRIDDKPLLMIYRAELMDQPKQVTELWREACRQAGIGEIYLTSVIFREFDPIAFGFDAAIEFPPHFFPAPDSLNKIEGITDDFDGQILDYEAGVRHSIKYPISKPFPVLRGVMPSWDNSARRGRSGTIFHGSTPELYGKWLRSAINQPCNNNDTQENIVFINAWNEWAEGAVLEPSQQYGRAYLEATRWAISNELPPTEQQPQTSTTKNTTQLQSVNHSPRGKTLEQKLTDFVLRSPTLTSMAFKNRKLAGSILNAVRKISGNTQQQPANTTTEPPSSRTGRRIVLVGHDAHPHGAQTLLLYIAKTLHHELGFSIDLILLENGRLTEDYRQYARVHELTSGIDTKELLTRLKEAGTRHAIVNTTVSGLFTETLKQQDFHIVSLIHELPGVIEQYQLQQHIQAIATNADKIIFPAESVKQGFSRYCNLPRGKSRILPQGLFRPNTLSSNTSRNKARLDLRKRFSLPEDAFVILGVGFIDRRKGVDLLIDVAENACKNEEKLYFIWVGHYDPQFYTELTKQLGQTEISDRVIFPGIDFDTDLYYAGADVFALTSREDPFPCVVLEALDARLPVIAFEDTGGFCALLKDLKSPLVPQFDTRAYASALLDLYHQPEKIKQIGDAGYNRVTQDYSFRRYCMELTTISPNLLKKVSVVLPNYNYSQFLHQRIEGIASQSYPIWEIIVLDDASSDDSVATLKKILPSISPDTRLVVNEHNSKSVFRQWQKGTSLATGDYLWIAEADDLAMPDFLQTVIQAFEDDSVVISYCESMQMAENGSILAEHYRDYLADISLNKWQEDYVNTGQDEICTALAIKNTLPNVSAIVFKASTLKNVLENHLEEISGFKIAGDWLTYIYTLHQGKIAFSRSPQNCHRRHGESVTLSSFGFEQLKEIISVQRIITQRYSVPAEIKAKAGAYAQQLYRQFNLATDECPDLKKCPELSE
jgi:glycosyltransferase involved in cell wall biosynthesis